MISKEKLLIQIDSFPENIEIEELIEKLILVDKIEKRLQLSKNDDTISETELNAEIEEWLK